MNSSPNNLSTEVVRATAAFLLDDDPTGRSAFISRLAAVGVICYALGDLKSLSHCDPEAPGCLVIVKRDSDEAVFAVLDERRQRLIDTPAVVVAENLDVPLAVGAMKRGASTALDLNATAESLQVALLDAFAFDAKRRQRDHARDALRRNIRTLSRGELDVLTLIVAGVKNSTIAKRLDVSVRTVEVRRSSAYVKLRVHSAAGMIAAVWQGLDGDLSKLAPPPADAPPA